MALIYNMGSDSSGGVCLKKHYSYSTFVKTGLGSSCASEIYSVEEDLINGTYILPYINQNANFSMDTTDSEICLNLGTGMTINVWVDNYINSLVTTGYTDGYDGSLIEDRVIYDQISNSYYIIQQTNNLIVCPLDRAERWAIYDTITNNIWDGINNLYYYVETDICGIPTGRLIVALKNINDNSETRYTLKYIEKCNVITGTTTTSTTTATPTTTSTTTATPTTTSTTT